MQLAKQSTARTLIVGPILDSTGAEYTGAVIGDVSISKNGGTLTALAAAATLTHIANGQYTLVLTTGNTDTLGCAQFLCNKSTYQMPMIELSILPATVYSALIDNATTAAGGLGDIQRMAGTALTGRDIGASVLLSSGTGTGQLDFTSGVVKANATQWVGGTIPAVNVTGVPLVDVKYLLGTVFPTPTVAGIPNVNVKTWNDLTTVALPLVPTTAGRTLDVSAGGEAGVDWANVGSPTTPLALTGTTIATTQQVDVNTIKTQTVTCAAGVTVLASVGTAATSTAQTGDNFARIGATGSGLTSLAPSATALSTATWTAARAGYLDNLNIGGPVSFGVDTVAIRAVTDLMVGLFQLAGGGPFFQFTAAALAQTVAVSVTGDVGGKVLGGGSGTLAGVGVQADVEQWKGSTAPAMTGDAFARLGAPAGASIAADLAEIEAETDGIASLPTAAAIATAVWTDTTAGDFTTASSPGKILVAQLGGAFTSTSSSVFSTAALANAPSGSLTVQAIVNGVWDEAAASHNTAATMGAKLNAAGGAADPLGNTVPGTYASGTAGAALGRIGSGQIVTTSVVAQSGAVSLVRGDDYFATDGRALPWTDVSVNWPVLTGASISFLVYDGFGDGAIPILTVAGSVITATGASKKVQVELTAANTAGLSTGDKDFRVVATQANGHIDTLVRGVCQVRSR